MLVVVADWLYLIAEYHSINTWKIWYYPQGKIFGIYFLDIPLEEYIYVIISPLIASSVICLIYYYLNKKKTI